MGAFKEMELKAQVFIPALAMMAMSAGYAASQPSADHLYSPEYNRCMDDAGGVTSSMLDCIHGELDKQDNTLNMAYKSIMSNTTSADRKTGLREAERQWIKGRDAKCKAAFAEGGTIAEVDGESCILEQTTLRAHALSHDNSVSIQVPTEHSITRNAEFAPPVGGSFSYQDARSTYKLLSSTNKGPGPKS